jgi:hypothetical protein
VSSGDIFLCIYETLSGISIVHVVYHALLDGRDSSGRAELLNVIWSISRKPLTPKGLAPEEDVHVAPEAVAELRRLGVIRTSMVPFIIVRIASAKETGLGMGGGERGEH